MKNKVTKTWLEARQFIKDGKLEEAEQALDLGIAYMAQAQEQAQRSTFGPPEKTMKRCGNLVRVYLCETYIQWKKIATHL